jgi:protoporphyrinogen oxidase
MTSPPARAIIIGAGPAGLTAAYELLRATSCETLVVEASDCIGGLSRTVVYRGYRMDLGGHRFFSRSDWVTAWWQHMLPLDPHATAEGTTVRLGYRAQHRDLDLSMPSPADDADADRVLLVRKRLSRIYHRRRFFDYPIRLDVKTIATSVVAPAAAGISYVAAQVLPRRPERHLEDFLVNRFGKRLYEAFFKSYTEKVWGVPCTAISADWGAQRIKGLSLTRAHACGGARARPRAQECAGEPDRAFPLPEARPGQLWEEVAPRAPRQDDQDAPPRRAHQARAGRVVSVDVRDVDSDRLETMPCDVAISSMPVCDLVACIGHHPGGGARRRLAASVSRLHRRQADVRRELPGIAAGGSIFHRTTGSTSRAGRAPGRLQVMNNWSPALVPDPSTAWLGLEYFCAEGDDLWSLTDAALLALAKRELQQIGIVVAADVLDGVVVRVPKAYPAYVGAYAQFGVVREWVDAIPKLLLVGRNGMHRYNNQDHSMLTAKAAVDNIVPGRTDKSNLWSINVDDDYLEEK